jgi:hypothetical protein
VAVAQADGAAFAEINKHGKLVYLGRLPQSPEAEPIIWREIRGYKNYIVVGSEATNHGIQIFDMSKVGDAVPQNRKQSRTDCSSSSKLTQGNP